MNHLTTNSILVTQKEPKGTGHAVLQAEKQINENLPLIVINGDTPLIESENVKKLIKKHQTHRATATIVTFNSKHTTNFGRIKKRP